MPDLFYVLASCVATQCQSRSPQFLATAPGAAAAGMVPSGNTVLTAIWHDLPDPPPGEPPPSVHWGIGHGPVLVLVGCRFIRSVVIASPANVMDVGTTFSETWVAPGSASGFSPAAPQPYWRTPPSSGGGA